MEKSKATKASTERRAGEFSGKDVTAVELNEKNYEKNRISSIRLDYDCFPTRTGELVSRVTYTRRYDIDAEFDSESKYYKIQESVTAGVRHLVDSRRLPQSYPPGRPPRKDRSYREIRVFSGRKLISRLVENAGNKDVFEELERILSRSIG